MGERMTVRPRVREARARPALPGWFSRAQAAVRSLAATPPDWDTYGAEPPNRLALHQAGRILHDLARFDLRPDRIAASAEGGVALAFLTGNRYADLECLNSGEVLAGTTDGDSLPQVWTVGADNIESTVGRIREHIKA